MSCISSSHESSLLVLIMALSWNAASNAPSGASSDFSPVSTRW